MTLTDAGGRTLDVGKILGVGRNYLDHAREMGAARPSEPLLFLMPPTALRIGDGDITLPRWTEEVHHEVEMVVRVGAFLKDATPEEAAACVDAVAVGIDFTARDVQQRAKERGEPWSVAKGFDGSAPISDLRAIRDARALRGLPLALAVNGTERQAASTEDMLWTVPELLAFASTRFTLEPGDLVFTGTPAGVGAVQPGDLLHATLQELSLAIRVKGIPPSE